MKYDLGQQQLSNSGLSFFVTQHMRFEQPALMDSRARESPIVCIVGITGVKDLVRARAELDSAVGAVLDQIALRERSCT